jgi:hypothetical protein
MKEIWSKNERQRNRNARRLFLFFNYILSFILLCDRFEVRSLVGFGSGLIVTALSTQVHESPLRCT